LLGAPRRLLDRRLAVGETGGLSSLADALGRALTEAGAVVTVLHHPDESTQASAANGFAADAFVALAVADEGCRVAYYAADGYLSEGGRHLAALAVEALRAVPGASVEAPAGMRLPVLRETRMPAVLIEIAPPALAVERAGELATALATAVGQWVADPIDLTEF
jgi:N-acetylmuramoyl-L-alanine amidase